jgi:hypothetical protein
MSPLNDWPLDPSIFIYKDIYIELNSWNFFISSPDRDDDKVHFVLDQHAELDFYSASSLKQQSAVDMSLHSDTLFWFWAN